MIGHDNSGRPSGKARRPDYLLLYSLIAIVAALAGFLTLPLVDRFAPRSVTIGDAPVQANTAQTSGESGFEKLVVAGEPKPLPPVSFTDADGRERTLSEWRGKVVLVNLWATWCAPCKVEMPSLDRLQAKLGGEDFAVLPISLDWSGAEKPRRFLDTEKLANLPLFLDSSKTAMKTFNAPGLPLSVLIDREGREIARLAGAAEWDSADAEAVITKAIEGSIGG
jgi:thiol-disulfide isomerase/thioredoxin